MGNHTFERIKERVNNYGNKGLQSKKGKEVITMYPVKKKFTKYSQRKG